MEGDRGRVPTWVAAVGFGFLTVNSALAVYRARGDPASIVFVAGSYLLLLVLFRCLRDYEQAPHGSAARERARRAAWPLTTLLTAVLPSRMDRKVAALLMAALGVMTCDTALAIYNDGHRGGLGSTTFVLVAYTALLVLISLFLREFAG
ncbi:hypothetical protein U9M48_029783 [Paspalum notatum var. saurae]|uniref:Uncharacterized protein n=1 Tax=Paspalum notatum var. saurae TaxID=547442 RepID=A0AAQ3TYL8_PASNO